MSGGRLTVRVRASPRGKRSGLFHYATPAYSITVLVLPKMWGRSGNQLAWGSGGQLTLILYEVGEAILALDSGLATFLVGTVQASIEDSARDSARPSAKRRKGEEVDDAALNELVRFTSSKADPTMSVQEPTPDDDPVGEGLIALTRLAMRCDPEQNPWVHPANADADPGGAVAETGRSTADPLGLLSQWLFVSLMESRLRKIRQGYVHQEETLGVIRGRISARGMLRHSASRLPAIECHFDDFTEATPLYRVLTTTLDLIAGGSIAARYGLCEWSVAKQLSSRALHLRRLLMPIPSLARPVAAQLAGALRLTPLQRDWGRPLTLARQLLRLEPPQAGQAIAGAHALQWWVDTAKLWERVVAYALKADQWDVVEQLRRSGGDRLIVWKGHASEKRPDILATRPLHAPSPRRVVVDAKYKGDGKIDAADQYQMFAYSLLVKFDGAEPAGPDAVALVYPETPDGSSHPNFTRGDLNVPDGAPLPLIRVSLRFPTPGELGSEWPRFIQAAGAELTRAFARASNG